MAWWTYEELESREPYDWSPAARGDSEWDNLDFHLDLGCGKLPKARIGIDRYPAEGVDLVINFDRLAPAAVEGIPGDDPATDEIVERTLETYNERITNENEKVGLPFPTGSIESIVSHHCFEHVGVGFIPLMDECYRILKPGGVLRIITPLFPSRTAVEDPDHKRWIMEDTFSAFCGGRNGESWLSSFSVPYTDCRFELVDKDITKRLEDPQQWWGPDDAREIRVALRKYDLEVEDAGGSEVLARPIPITREDSVRGDDGAGGTTPAPGERELAGVA